MTKQVADSLTVLEAPLLALHTHHVQAYVFKSQLQWRLAWVLLKIVSYFQVDELSNLLRRQAGTRFNMLAYKGHLTH